MICPCALDSRRPFRGFSARRSREDHSNSSKGITLAAQHGREVGCNRAKLPAAIMLPTTPRSLDHCRRTRHAAFRWLLGIAAARGPITYKMLISPEAKPKAFPSMGTDTG
jgi:hypothetical protein